MDQSSAELPVDRLLAACEGNFDFHCDRAIEEWDSRPANHTEWLLEYESKEGFVQAMSLERGPTKLYHLCLAAKAAGETKVRVTAEDFFPISAAFQ